MFNPSSADAVVDDPTVRSCWRITTRQGYRKMVIVNTLAYRTPYPADVKAAALAGVPITGPDNDRWINSASIGASRVVVAWGSNALPDRAQRVAELLETNNPTLYCLGTNKNGSPKHPLYIASATELVEWEIPR
jgi:hypothetical protein